MANAFKHKRYYRVRLDDSSICTFGNVTDAQNAIGFRDAFDTSSPTTTYALADSDQTLVVTHEFDTADEQTAFKAAVDSLMDDSSTPWNPDASGIDGSEWCLVEHFKTEWLHEDGSVSSTADFSFPPYE